MADRKTDLGKTAALGAIKPGAGTGPVATSDNNVADPSAEAEQLRGRTDPPPKPPAPDVKKFPQALVAIAESNSSEEAEILRRTLGVVAAEERIEVAGGESARSDEPTDVRMESIRASIAEELGAPEEPEPIAAPNAADDSWEGDEDQGKQPADDDVADLPMPDASAAEPPANETGTEGEQPSHDTASSGNENKGDDIKDTMPAKPFILLVQLDDNIVSSGTKAEIGEELMIGRDQNCGMQIPSPFVSNYHAKVVKKDGEFFLKGLSKKSATKVAGKALPIGGSTMIKLAHGNVIEFGDIGRGAKLVFLDPLASEVVVHHSPSEAADQAVRPAKEEVVTKQEQHAATQPLDTTQQPVPAVSDDSVKDKKPAGDTKPAGTEASKPDDGKKKSGKDDGKKDDKGGGNNNGGNANGPPNTPRSRRNLVYIGLTALVALIIVAAIVVVGSAIKEKAVAAYSAVAKDASEFYEQFSAEKTATTPAVVPAAPKPPQKMSMADINSPELADRIELVVPPEYIGLLDLKVVRPKDYVPDRNSPILEYATGDKPVRSFKDCFPPGKTVQAADQAWCCTMLYNGPGRLDGIYKMVECLQKSDIVQYNQRFANP